MLVHTDVWGLAPVSTNSSYRCFVIFVDYCTHMTWLYLMKHKRYVYDYFYVFRKMVQTQFSTTLKVVCSDNGGEYVNKLLQPYFQDHGIGHETTCPQPPQQNGVAKRKNRQILEIARASHIGAHMRPTYWEDVVISTVDLKQPWRNFQDMSFFLLFSLWHHTFLGVLCLFIFIRTRVLNLILVP